jgi:hypothetical protein
MNATGGAPAAAPPRLHLPSEPIGRREEWRDAVLEGASLADVVGGAHGVAAWFWARWSVLGSLGLGAEAFAAVAVGYRRELWFWLMGERTWEHCCAGLIGRVGRRLRS